MLLVLVGVLFTSSLVCSTDVMVPSVANYDLPLVLYKVNSQINRRCNYITDLRSLVEDLTDVEDKVRRISSNQPTTTTARRSEVEKMAKDLEQLTTVTLQSIQNDISRISYNKLPQMKEEMQRRLKAAEEGAERLIDKLQRLQQEKENLERAQDQLRERIAKLEGRIESNTQPPPLPTTTKLGNIGNFEISGDEGGLSGSGLGVTAFIWPVDNYSDKKRKNEPIYSPPFYHKKGNYGYKLRLYAYIGGENVDGWISVYLQVMAGPDDDNLPWPITGEYSFHITSKKFGVRDLIKSAEFDAATTNWYKPGSPGTDSGFAPNNIPYGYREAFRHDDVENSNYLVNDQITISFGIRDGSSALSAFG